MIETRRCHGACGRIRDVMHFHKGGSAPGGYQYLCIDCAKAKRRLYLNRVIAVDPPSGRKWCGGCQHSLRLDRFSLHVSNCDGRQTRCKDCMKPLQHAWKLRQRTREERAPAQ